MSFPQKTILIDGVAHNTVGVGVNVFGQVQDELKLYFDGVMLPPSEKTRGKEYWVIVERESRKVVSRAMGTIDEAKRELYERCLKASRKVSKAKMTFISSDLLMKMKAACQEVKA